MVDCDQYIPSVPSLPSLWSLDFQPLLEKRARVPPLVLFVEEQRPDARDWRKSRLLSSSPSRGFKINNLSKVNPNDSKDCTKTPYWFLELHESPVSSPLKRSVLCVNDVGLTFFLVFSRWCVLTGNSLDYYKSYVKNSPKFGSIVLTSLCSVVSPEEREPGTILPANILLLYLKERRRTDEESKQSAKFLFPYFANLGALPSLLIFVFDFRSGLLEHSRRVFTRWRKL